VQPHLALGKSGRNVEEDVDVGAAHYKFVDAAYLGMLQDGRIVGWQYGRMYCARFLSAIEAEGKAEAQKLLSILACAYQQLFMLTAAGKWGRGTFPIPPLSSCCLNTFHFHLCSGSRRELV